MGMEDNLFALIDLVYEAVSDGSLWPVALTKLADTMGAAQIGVATLDRRTGSFDSIAPRTDPLLDESYKRYWAFHNPLWPLAAARPVGEIYSLDSLMPRNDFSATPIFNDWWRPAEYGLAMLGANLLVEDQVSALICAANAPANNQLTGEQTIIFKAALRHIGRAIRIHRTLRMLDLNHDTAPDRLDRLRQGVVLVDSTAKVLFANAAARALLDAGGELALEGGTLGGTGGTGAIQRLATCMCKVRARNGPGGEFLIPRGPHRPALLVTVAPLRAEGTVAELPWLGLRIPAAIVTISEPAAEQWVH